jgi:hypothetical protein
MDYGEEWAAGSEAMNVSHVLVTHPPYYTYTYTK